MDRRPLKVRSTQWAKTGAAQLAQLGITPNTISIMSVIFAMLVLPMVYWGANNRFLFLICALLIQMRLICNLLDGMVAVEHSKSMPNGELFNDVPDRFADLFIILGAGFSIPTSLTFILPPIHLAWLATVLAILTAYVRVLGKSLGTTSYFIGPMAKQHRMFFLTIAFLGEFIMRETPYQGILMYGVLCLIALGSFITVFRRLFIISNDLMKKGDV